MFLQWPGPACLRGPASAAHAHGTPAPAAQRPAAPQPSHAPLAPPAPAALGEFDPPLYPNESEEYDPVVGARDRVHACCVLVCMYRILVLVCLHLCGFCRSNQDGWSGSGRCCNL